MTPDPRPEPGAAPPAPGAAPPTPGAAAIDHGSAAIDHGSAPAHRPAAPADYRSGPAGRGAAPPASGAAPSAPGAAPAVLRRLTGPLGGRLLAAFLLVALSSVAVLTVAALVATDRGLASARSAERQQTTDRAAAAAADAYTRAGGWSGADLTPVGSIAQSAGANLFVLDTDGSMLWPGRGMGPGMGSGMGPGMGQGARNQPSGSTAQAGVVVDGVRVGTVRLVFTGASTGGRTVAWSWVAGAAAVALATALLVSWYVAHRLAGPLVHLAGVARRFAAGERGARARLDAPGELGELAHAFDAMADDVARAETVRRNLAADVAHELRTPLAALQAGLEELRDGLHPADPGRLAGLHDQALRLGRVVHDLAELSAAESAALSLRLAPTDLAEVARAALDAQRPQLTAAGVRVETDLDTAVPVRADVDRLHQAVGNLLANAARYCAPGDRVRIAAGPGAGGWAELTVADTGPGIPAAELPHVFERLWRGDRARAVAGSGIGLAVVRELVTAHGGTVGVAADVGRGSTFTIRLPRHPPVSPPSSRTR